MTLRYLSVCAGIEAFSVAVNGLPFEPVMFSEIELFPRAVLEHRQYASDLRGGTQPGRVALWGDMTALRVRHFRRFGIPLPEVIVGGTPCQAFSVAGLRKGLSDPRGGLTLDFVRLCHAFAAAGPLHTVVWENVPGILSHAENPFGCFLGALIGADDALHPPDGKSWPRAGMVSGPRARAAWRVLDAQYFGVAQQRKRLFLVIDFGNGADPAEVLFERESLRRNSAPRHQAGQRPAARSKAGARTDVAGLRQSAAYGGNNCSGPIEVSPALTAHGGPSGRMDFETEAFIAEVAPALRARGDFDNDGDERALIAFDCKSSDPARGVTGEVAGTLRAMASSTSQQNGGGNLAVMSRGNMAVRRLTPRECERLQGFTDDYTLIPWRNGLAPDGLRYRALGNSMAVPVMRWIARRVAAALAGGMTCHP